MVCLIFEFLLKVVYQIFFRLLRQWEFTSRPVSFCTLMSVFFPRPSQRCPLLYWICHCTEHNHFPTIVILSSSEQEKHSSGSGKLFFFLPPIFVFAFLRSYISIASLQYNSVTSVYKNILFFISCLSEKTQEKYSVSL